MKKPKLGFIKNLKENKGLKNIVTPVSILVAAGLLLGYKILSLTPYTEREYATNLGSATFEAIQNNALFAPLKSLQILILKFTSDDTYIRAASAITALSAALLLLSLLRRWQSTRVAVMTTLLFITSTFYLMLGRSANLEVYYLAVIPAILLSFVWLISGKDSKKIPLAAVLLGLSLYAPSSWVFVLLGLLFLRKALVKSLSSAGLAIKSISSLLFIGTISPLVAGFAINRSHLIEWIGINTENILNFKEILSRTVSLPDQLFLNGIDNPQIWVFSTPILDIFMSVMLILGIYAYRAGYYPTREKLAFGATVLALIAIIIGNVATIALVIPIIFILIANGISYMLQSWFTVFPRNPVARSIGIILLIIVILMSCYYQLQRYFIAWPNTEPVKALTVTDSSVTINEEETKHE